MATGLLLSLVLLLATLAASSSLHHSHHSDRPGDDHPCGLCLFAHGKVVADGGAPALPRLPSTLVKHHHVTETSLPARIEYRWSPSRAPPA